MAPDGAESVEALSHPLRGRTSSVPGPPQRVSAAAASSEAGGKKAARRVSIENHQAKDEDAEDCGEGYYAEKFSQFYRAFVATTPTSAMTPRYAHTNFRGVHET